MRYLCNLLYFSIILDVRSFPSYVPGIIEPNYHNSHYFRSQIFHARNFRVTIFSSISRMRHNILYSLCIILLVNNIRVRNFRRFGWNENFLTTKISRITVSSMPGGGGYSNYMLATHSTTVHMHAHVHTSYRRDQL